MKNPIYKIENQTPYEINYKQKSSDEKGQKNDGYFIKLKSGESKAFTWDDFVHNKILEVDVENQKAEYSLDKIMDYAPIALNFEDQNIIRSGMKVKKGFLGRKELYGDDFVQEYAVLNMV